MNRNTQNYLKREIKRYYYDKQGVTALEDRYQLIQDRLNSAKGQVLSPVPAFGGGSRHEDTMVDLICEKAQVEERLRINSKSIHAMEKAMKALSKQEKEVILRLWGKGENADKIGDDLSYSRASVYRVSDEALDKLAISYFGI